MPETEEVKKEEKTDVDERGVPLINKVKELDRKFADKERELAQVRQELAEFKAAIKEPETETKDPKEKLMEFVQDPDAWYLKKRAAEDQEKFQREFQNQIPEAEKWIKDQKGYSQDDDARIFQIITENKLNTPHHLPMERAKTAWKILNAEKREKEMSTMTEETRRETVVRKTSADGGGKSTQKTDGPTRAELIRKLSEASAKGDLDGEIRYTSMLEDVR